MMRNGQTQQEFLRTAMSHLSMSKDEFGQRFGVTKKTLTRWLSASDTSDHRKMPEMAWVFIEEVIGKK